MHTFTFYMDYWLWDALRSYQSPGRDATCSEGHLKDGLDSNSFPKYCVKGQKFGPVVSKNTYFYLGVISCNLKSYVVIVFQHQDYANRRFVLDKVVVIHTLHMLILSGDMAERLLQAFSNCKRRHLESMFGLKSSRSCQGVFRENQILTFPCLYILESTCLIMTNRELFQSRSSSYNRLEILPHSTTFFSEASFVFSNKDVQ